MIFSQFQRSHCRKSHNLDRQNLNYLHGKITEEVNNSVLS